MIYERGAVTETIEESFSDKSYKDVIEMLIIDEVSQLSDDKIKEFCESGGVGEQLVREGKIGRKTIVRLSKKDDWSRRRKQMAIKLARENNDPLFDKLALNRVKERDLLAKIMQKYGNKGGRLATQSQKEYLHPASSKRVLPKTFLKNHGEEN